MAVREATTSAGGIRSLAPAGAGRLGWSRFPTRMVVALGVAWTLDGLEASIASDVSFFPTDPRALNTGAGAVATAG